MTESPSYFIDEQPPQVDVAQLQQITRKAIQRGKDEAARKLAASIAAEERKKKSEQLFAARVLAEVPDKCYKEAERERTHALIMGLKCDRDYSGCYDNSLRPNQLIGPAKIVWDNLVEMRLKPTLEYWWSGDGMDSGYNIVAHWEA